MSSKNESYFKNIFDDWSALLSFPTSTAPIDFDTLVKTHLPAMSFDNDIDPLTGSASPSCPSDSSQTSSNPLWTAFYAKTEAIKQIEIGPSLCLNPSPSRTHILTHTHTHTSTHHILQTLTVSTPPSPPKQLETTITSATSRLQEPAKLSSTFSLFLLRRTKAC